MCKFAALVSPNESTAVAEVTEECQADVDGRFFRLRQENPHPARGTVDNKEVGTVPIIRCNNPIRILVWLAVVFGRCPHEAKIHEELRTSRRDAFRCRPGGLLPDISPFLKVDASKGVVFQDRREADNMLREDVQLVLARGTEP